MAMASAYNPAVHHRHSIRMKGHDYARGGLYFVTICAHRDAGNIFAPDDVKEMVARVWEKIIADAGGVGAPLVGALIEEGTHKGCPYAIMPDHFHGLIRMSRGGKSLGDAIGAFKSLVVHEYIAKVKTGEWPPFPGKLWHRNYYECIVRNDAAHENISHYIRMNPWRLITEGTHEECPYRAIGNPALLNLPKIGIFCSRAVRAPLVGAPLNAPPICGPEKGQAQGLPLPIIGGFHSDPEKTILAEMLKTNARIICCPAWGIDEMHIPPDWLPALEQNRMLILEWKQRHDNNPIRWTDARDRNAFVMQMADKIWIPYMTPGGMLERLVKELGVQGKMVGRVG